MISIIIPARNEEKNIGKLLHYLQTYAPGEEIIVVDGESTDNTIREAKSFGVKVISSTSGRAKQMNKGASFAKEDILYFLHADTLPPKNFVKYIEESVEHQYGFGFFKIKIEPSHFWIRFFEWIGSIKSLYFVFGDRSLFVKKELFESIEGFNEKLFLMEDQEIVFRLKKHSTFVFLPQIIRASNRKYVENGFFRLELIYTILFFMYYLGFSQKILIKTYKKLIRSKQYE